MPLENAFSIDELVESNPSGLDRKEQGDDHIRMLKRVLKRTFPGMQGAFARIQSISGTHTLRMEDNLSTLLFISGTPTVLLPPLASSNFLQGFCCLLAVGGGVNVTLSADGSTSINGFASYQLGSRDRMFLLAGPTSWFGVHVMDYRNTRTEDMNASRPKLQSPREFRNFEEASSSIVVNCAAAATAVYVLTGNITSMSFTNVPTSPYSFAITLILIQDSTGGRTINWPFEVKWPGGSAPTLTVGAGKIDVVTLMTYDGGASWLGFLGGQGF